MTHLRSFATILILCGFASGATAQTQIRLINFADTNITIKFTRWNKEFTVAIRDTTAWIPVANIYQQDPYIITVNGVQHVSGLSQVTGTPLPPGKYEVKFLYSQKRKHWQSIISKYPVNN